MVMRRRMGGLIRIFVHAARRILPLLFWVALLIIKLMGMTAISLIVGIPEATDRFAREQEAKYVDNGRLPNAHAHKFYVLVRVIAVLVVLAGWICLSFTTVYLVTLIL